MKGSIEMRSTISQGGMEESAPIMSNTGENGFGIKYLDAGKPNKPPVLHLHRRDLYAGVPERPKGQGLGPCG